MELVPQDIGKERYLALMRRRMAYSAQQGNGAQGTASASVFDDSPLHPRLRRRTTKLRRYWVRGLNLDEDTGDELSQAAWKGAPAVGPRIAFIILTTYMFMGAMIALGKGAPPEVLVALIAAWSAMTYGLSVSPKIALRKLNAKALTIGEIDQMLPVARGRLERTYLNLVREAIQQDIPSSTVQVDIRAALRDLGETISRLPADAVPTHDAVSLRTDAENLRVKARLEPDGFVQGSLLRQAAALDRRASLASQNSSTARRTYALRQEAKSQIEALRTVMLAFQQTSHADSATVAHLSEALQRVAQEAQAASVARRELEEDEISMLLGKPLPANLPAQPTLAAPLAADPTSIPVPQRIAPAAPAEPEVQMLQPGRPWWRGQ